MIHLNETVLGIELGSTRIKAVLIDRDHVPVASGSHDWENHLENGVWTYSYDEIKAGIKACYADLKRNVKDKLGCDLTTVGAMGISGMMHGYLPLDKAGEPLTGFRTWRNTITAEAAERLTELFSFTVPQRWSIAHLYQAMLNREEHLPRLASLATVSVYLHHLLTGEFTVGIGEASGMFPIDSETLDYDESMIRAFDALIPGEYPWKLRDVLPKVRTAGQIGGVLTEAGARFLDPTGTLKPGIPLAPPEGDAGTGMTATNSVRVGTGNVSAGTSAFIMIVSDKKLAAHREINMVTTPDGAPVAMTHANTCTSDINAWVGLFGEALALFGHPVGKDELYTRLFQSALEGAPDGGGLMAFNCVAGEDVIGLDEGRPLFLRKPGAPLTLSDFFRTHLMSALATLAIGVDILKNEEQVAIRSLCAHGGYFKTPGVGQRLLSAAIGVPVTVMETAGEGGPYGMALLAAYMLRRKEGESLADYLDNRVFTDAKTTVLTADEAEIAGFRRFLDSYRKAIPTVKTAVETTR